MTAAARIAARALGTMRSPCGRSAHRVRRVAACFGCLLPLTAAALEINSATRAELEQLNGVGVAMAERVLNERAKAPFRDWDDLQRRVKGMAGARIERLQAQGVTVNGSVGSRAARDGAGKR